MNKTNSTEAGPVGEQKGLIGELEQLIESLEGIREKVAIETMYLRNHEAPLEDRLEHAISFVKILADKE